jgi:hypothetical protein
VHSDGSWTPTPERVGASTATVPQTVTQEKEQR